MADAATDPPDSGAVDVSECPRRGRGCRCGKCANCGEAKHTAVHGPLYGQPPGSRPYRCRFTPKGDKSDG